jgi:hypothetical protein
MVDAGSHYIDLRRDLVAQRQLTYVRYLAAMDALDTTITTVLISQSWRETNLSNDPADGMRLLREVEPAKWDAFDEALRAAQLMASEPTREC